MTVIPFKEVRKERANEAKINLGTEIHILKKPRKH